MGAEEPTILSVSLFAFGHSLGPLLEGLMSAIYERNVIYRASGLFNLFFVFMFPVAFSPHTGIYVYVLLMYAFSLGLGGITRHADSCLLKFLDDVRVLWLSVSQCEWGKW